MIKEEDKAIVTNIAGTTRDIVEGTINIDGILLNIIDTAGIRKTNDKVESIDGTLIVTADHGNCDIMWDENKKPVTSHTTNKVPCIITKEGLELNNGKLADVAPTMLELIGLRIPNEMTGASLIK